MTNKRPTIFLSAFILFFIWIFYRNTRTYNSLKAHTAYAMGVVIKVVDEGGGWYTTYQYTAGGNIFHHRQGGKWHIMDTILVVYDSTHPKYSMIANYDKPITADSNGFITNLDAASVSYSWWNYLPGDDIKSIGDFLSGD